MQLINNKPTTLVAQQTNGTKLLEYFCPICEKPVGINATVPTHLSKTYYLACSHYVHVQVGAISPFSQQVKEPSVSSVPPARKTNPISEKYPDIEPDSRWDSFLPFQQKGIKFFADSGFTALLADDMGLGKTIQAIGALRYYPEQTMPVLIVCPASVTVQWQRQIRKWLLDAPQFKSVEYVPFIQKETASKLFPDQNIYIISNAVLAKPKMLEQLKTYGFKTVIVDESHQFKNSGSKRTKALFELCDHIPQTILMSGTSVLNRVMEYWNSLAILRPKRWFQKKQLSEMCTSDSKGRPLALSPYYKDRFFQDTAGYILRRTKKEVLPDLPEKFVTQEWIAFDGSKRFVDTYNMKLQELEEILARMDESGMSESTSASMFGAIAELRHMLGIAKAARACDIVADSVHSNGEKIAVAVHHRLAISMLKDSLNYKKCPSCETFVFERHDGEEETSSGLTECTTCGSSLKSVPAYSPVIISNESVEHKQAALDKFRDDPNQAILIISILGGGVGLDIQFCPNVLVVEREWNGQIERQFEDRFVRIGMKSSVTISYLLAENTIDEFFDEMCKLKNTIVDSTLDRNYAADSSFIRELAAKVISKRLKFVGA